jgi:DNA-binding response OmpR family regulator
VHCDILIKGPRPVLIVDDDVDYSCLMQVALMEAQVNNPILVINDGCAALDYGKCSQSEYPWGNGEVPALVLLDLWMPKISGLEVLSWMRGLSRWTKVPVVVFTGVEAGDEPSQALALGASSVLMKPFTYRELVQTARELRDSYLADRILVQAA